MSSPAPIAVWTIQGETRTCVECWITPSDMPPCNLTVTYGGEVVLLEGYVDVETASLRAEEIKNGLLAHGWTAAPTNHGIVKRA